MATKRAAAKAATKARPAKKRPAKKLAVKAASKQNGSPKTIQIKGDLRYKLENLKLKLDARQAEIAAPIQQAANSSLKTAIDRSLRNDPAFGKLSDEWNEVLAAAVEKTSPGKEYVAQSVDVAEGTLKFVPATK